MKKIFIILCLLSVFFTGCQGPVKQKPVEVTIEGGGKFPGFLAGRWEADEGGWQFLFEPNGIISSMVHSMGRVELEPGKTARVPMKMGKKSIFEPGEWIVDYESATRILTVKIELKHFYTEIGTGTIKGSFSDVFIGPVSEDKLIWNANWTTFLKSTSHTPENPSVDLSTDPIYGESRDIVFRKVEK